MEPRDHKLIATLHADVTQLAGLSFGGLTSAAEAPSRNISRSLVLLGSGLLSADAPSSIASVHEELLSFFSSRAARSVFHWQLLSPAEALSAATFFSSTSVKLLTFPTRNDTLPIPRAPAVASNLVAVTHLIAHAASNIDSATAISPDEKLSAQAHYAVLRLLHCTDSMDSDGEVHGIASHLADTLCKSLKVLSSDALLISHWQSLYPLLRTDAFAEADSYAGTSRVEAAGLPCAYHVVTSVGTVFSRSATPAQFETSLPSLLALALSLGDSSEVALRLSALSVLQAVLSAPAEQRRFHSAALVRVARSALSALDADTTAAVFAVLSDVVRAAREGHGGLDKDSRELLEEALKALLHHADASASDGSAQVYVAVDCLYEYAKAGRDFLRSQLETWTVLCMALLQKVAKDFVAGKATQDELDSVQRGFKEALKWTWMRAVAHAGTVIDGCIVATMFARGASEHEKEDLLIECTAGILAALAECHAQKRYVNTLRKLKTDTEKYPSLKLADRMLNEALDRIDRSEYARSNVLEKGKFGPLVERFFAVDDDGEVER